MADRSLQDIFKELNYWGSTNIGDSPLTYLNPQAQLKYSSFGGPMFGLRPALGWVTQLPGINNNINFSRQRMPRGNQALLSLLAHESAHTTQPLGLGNMFQNKLLSSAPYKGYDPEMEKPPAMEVLASLRDKEAMAPKGKQWYNTIEGEEYLNELIKANPKRSRQSIVQEVDRMMFPEFGVMHEGPEKPQLTKQQGFLEKLMQMFR